MTFENFEKFIALDKANSEKIFKLCELGVDLINYEETNNQIFNLLLSEIFPKEAIDWIYWFMYERHDNGKPQAWDEDGTVICFDTVEDLYNFIQENYGEKI